MRALQVIQPRSFSTVEVPIPQLEADSSDQILVRTTWISMCGSDIPFFIGSKRYQTFPLPWGSRVHECLGQVTESTSERFQVGDWVVAIPENDQGLAEFFVAQASNGVQLPNDLEEKSDYCLIQPLSTVMKAVDRLGDIRGRSVAVVGLGSIGLLFCWLLRKRGIDQIIGIDPIAWRCQMAENFGANKTYPMRSIEVVHHIRQNSTKWIPPEICIEAVGHQMETLNDCFELIQKQGTVLAFGVPDQPVYAIEFETFFRKNLHLMAVVTPDWQDYLQRSRDPF
jgi:L-iditol 2-dehydrogenase